MKILISWLAFSNDFENGTVKTDGPTFNYHRYYFNNNQKHVLLSSAAQLDQRAELLASELRKEFVGRDIEVHYMDILEVININIIKSKIEPLLLDMAEHEIDIFMSPGTPSMQIVWYLCHMTLGLKTNLYQMKELKHSDKKLGYPERIRVEVEKSISGYTAVIREQGVKEVFEDYRITESIKPIYAKANLIAETDSVTTLIYGESGTGKEHLAKYIHKNSSRKDKPFIAINCSAFTDELLESRLFGHLRGAFTGADKDHKGFFEEAKGGTIFLDEIGDISPYMQQSLLRVLQEKKILGVGYTAEKKVDVRVIAATNKNLSSLSAEGKFRWDLYYRLAVTELSLPPLRLRKEIERKDLINFFLQIKKKSFKRSKQLVFSQDALRVILNYPFYGNVRELENLIESLYVYNTELVKLDSLPPRMLEPTDENKMDLASVERRHIYNVLKMTKSNAQAAKILGIALNTLKSKLKTG